MRGIELERILRRFDWKLLSRMYGCAHNSIIGFISSQWLRQSVENYILDGAPSPTVGHGRTGQKNADILLFKGDRPFMVVEVETQVIKYRNKIDSLRSYLKNTQDYNGIEAGLLFMTNLCRGDLNYKHQWTSTKEKVKNFKHTIVLVSIEKSKIGLNNSTLSQIRRRNNYYPWQIHTIDYWIHTANQQEIEGNLWRR